MTCKHEEVSVYFEVRYEAKIIDGKVVYNGAESAHEELVEAVCTECEEDLSELPLEDLNES